MCPSDSCLGPEAFQRRLPQGIPGGGRGGFGPETEKGRDQRSQPRLVRGDGMPTDSSGDRGLLGSFLYHFHFLGRDVGFHRGSLIRRLLRCLTL